MGAEWVTGPGRPIVIKTVQRTSARYLDSDLAWAPTHTLTNPFTEVVDPLSGPFNPRCRDWVPPYGDTHRGVSAPCRDGGQFDSDVAGPWPGRSASRHKVST